MEHSVAIVINWQSDSSKGCENNCNWRRSILERASEHTNQIHYLQIRGPARERETCVARLPSGSSHISDPAQDLCHTSCRTPVLVGERLFAMRGVPICCSSSNSSSPRSEGCNLWVPAVPLCCLDAPQWMAQPSLGRPPRARRRVLPHSLSDSPSLPCFDLSSSSSLESRLSRSEMYCRPMEHNGSFGLERPFTWPCALRVWPAPVAFQSCPLVLRPSTLWTRMRSRSRQRPWARQE